MEVGRATGIPFKEMSAQIVAVKLDMDTFTDITIEGAARMTASLKQLGLSVSSFKNMMQPFRDFDTAATKMGDMSAMFGVQMDAMEMMYLANEDEEEFLRRMREQLLDQGLDVENMSKTRQRALADQLGMGVQEMKMFMNTGQRMTDETEMQAATQEAATKTQADALKSLDENTVKIAKSTEELAKQVRGLQTAFAAPAVAQGLESVAEANQKLINLGASAEGMSGKIIKFQSTLNTFLSKTVATGLDYFGDRIIPALDTGLSDAAEFAGSKAVVIGDKLNDGMKVAEANVADGMRKTFGPQSWPPWLYGIRDALLYPGSDEVRTDYIDPTFKKMMENIDASISENAKPVDFSPVFESLSGITESATTEADRMVTKINEVLAGIKAPEIEADITPVISSQSATLAKDVSVSISESTKDLVEKFNRVPTPVEVEVDTEKLTTEVVKAIKDGLKEGFDDTDYKFAMNINGTKFADVMATARTSKLRQFKTEQA
jgi:hypothetical protein